MDFQSTQFLKGGHPLAQHIIELFDVCKDFSGTQVLKNINLYVRKNEFITLLGPSGCGKTTTLRLIAGFEQPTRGQIYFYDQCINRVPPYQRRLNTVFQRYALFPHLTVADNIAFGLKIRKVPAEEMKTRIAHVLKLVGLSGYEKRWPDSLSGGQQQRVAIARALVNQPEVLLLDEPLGALDLKMRQGMQIELKNMQRQLGITFIYVTHDQEEALTMSDTVVVMKDGRIQQIGTPEDIYNEPKNAFVADFIGESNIIDGLMKKDFLVEFAGREFVCVDAGFGFDIPVDVVVRPEDIKVVAPEEGMLKGIVTSLVFLGVHYEMQVEATGFNWRLHSTQMYPVGSEIGMNILPDDIHIMEKSAPQIGEEES